MNSCQVNCLASIQASVLLTVYASKKNAHAQIYVVVATFATTSKKAVSAATGFVSVTAYASKRTYHATQKYVHAVTQHTRNLNVSV